MDEEREYQDEALQLALGSIQSCGGFALFMEQRTGKTVVSCRIVEELKPRRLLVTCPEKALQIWEKHFQDRGFYDRFEIQIVLRDSLWGQRKRLKRWKPDLTICDEGHDFKGQHSKRSRALRIIGRVSKARLLLTGTPQESGFEDYWAQMTFVNPRLFGEWKNFQRIYLRMGGFRRKRIIGYTNEKLFQRKIKSCSYRVLLEDVKEEKTDLPAPRVRYFDLVESRPHYNRMRDDFLVELNRRVRVRKLHADGSTSWVWKKKRVVASQVITQAMKLHQVSGGFIMDEDKVVHRFGDEKLEQAGLLLLELGDVPVVFFVRFLPELYRLGKLCRILGRDVTYISGKHKDYISGTPFDVAVVQIQSGVSIDLAHSEEAVFYSWTYSFLHYDQARMRIRSFTSKRARYHYLVARNSIDEDLLSCVLTKSSFAEIILDKYRK